ncbi:chemotaxis protein CheB [uncultured Roseobacter sp.]|uniref:chemotaxis protein CheB n=1 Tax=uncultured Roseobacter sp. TaxID=114847 RepID=UPI002617EBFA|nr:chemotaxis protein CheB [uncultured Roseobacter sp.]
MSTTPTRSHVVAIGASAGGLDAIRTLIAELPEGLAAPIVIAVHSAPDSRLTEILKTRSALNIKRAEDDERLNNGWIYIVPGATHAFFRGGDLRLSKTVKNSGFRPSIDALFMTLAAEHGDRAIAVVLSGNMNDGMRGAQVIYDMGGMTVVQSPDEAGFSNMPSNVIAADHPKEIMTARDLGRWLRDKIGPEPKQKAEATADSD